MKLLDKLTKIIKITPAEHQKPIQDLLTFVSGRVKPFILIIQPGAGAPVSSFIEEWKKAGLAGCTDEICELSADDGILPNVVIINTMTPAEHLEAATKNARLVGPLKQICVINDPHQVLKDLLELNTATVNERSAYLPQGMIFGSDSEIQHIIRPEVVSGLARSYVMNIKAAFESSLLKDSPARFPGMMFSRPGPKPKADGDPADRVDTVTSGILK